MRYPARLAIAAALALFFGCSESAEEVSVDLTLDPSISSDSITQFIFVATPDGAEGSSVFPSACVNSSLGCLTSGPCGFSATEASFELKFPLTGALPYPDGGSVSVVACALDNDQNILGSGQQTVVNQGGTAASITLTASDGACATSLPSPCP